MRTINSPSKQKSKMKRRIYKTTAWSLIAAGSIIAAICYYMYIYGNIHTVVDGRIYRSAKLSGTKLEKVISEKKLKAIINLVGKAEDEQWYQLERRIADNYGVQHYTYGLLSKELPRFPELTGLVESLEIAPRPLLIHCVGGADRTGLASALAVALETNMPLSDLKHQFSLLYGVLPFSGSTGPRFFKKYERWLAQTGKPHSWDVLSEWIENVYIDDRGNIEYAVDLANGIEFRTKKADGTRTVTLRSAPSTIKVHGWAFDRKNNKAVENIFLTVAGHKSENARFFISRPDVAALFALDRNFFPDFKVGWAARFDGVTLQAGCHEVYLNIQVQGRSPYAIFTDKMICIEDKS